jgi:hypothetical protein
MVSWRSDLLWHALANEAYSLCDPKRTSGTGKKNSDSQRKFRPSK